GEDAGTPETQSSTDCFPYAEDKDLPSTEVQQEENFHNPTVEQQRTATTEEEVLHERNSEQEAVKNCPRDPYLLTSFATHRAKALVLGQDLGCMRVYHHCPSWELGKEIERVQNIVNVWGLGRIGAIFYKHYNSALITAFAERLIGLRVDGDLTVVKGAWGALAVKEIWRKCMYLPNSVYLDLKARGRGISLSLKKIVEFFAGKVGTNVHDSASVSSIRLSSRMVRKAYMLYVLGSFLFPTKKGRDVSVKYLSFFQDQHVSKPWSWGAATLAHFYYSLGASSRVNTKGLASCTTLLESWIFEHFSKLPGIPTRNESGAPEFCTRWCWSKTTRAQTGSVALAIFREALDSYKVEDPYYPDRVQRQFNRKQLMPRAPAFVEKSGLRFGDKVGPYNPKYDWEDLFSEEKWRDSITLMRGRKVYNGIPVCSEGYFEWFNSVSFTKLCPNVVNLGEDADYDGARVLGASSGVSQRENTSECAFFMEATGRIQANIEAKNLANSICEKKLNEKILEYKTNTKLLKDLTLECESTKKILEDQRLECESNKKLVEDMRMQLAAKANETGTLGKINDKLMDKVYVHQIEVPLPLNIASHPEENVGEAEMWKQKYEELHVKFEETQRRLSEIDRNVS
ncbi:hypothetical protein GIB67_019978, partial [Kingdonia uniflora]